MKSALYPVAVAMMTMAAPALASDHAASFLTKAMQGDNSETTLGEIAAQRGASAGVRQFGHMLSSDHRRAKAEAAAVARRLGVRVTNQMAPEAIAERAKLSRLHGRGFDQEFAHYMVEDHRKDIADFTAEASSRDQRAVVGLARQTLPVLRAHLEMAERLAR